MVSSPSSLAAVNRRSPCDDEESFLTERGNNYRLNNAVLCNGSLELLDVANVLPRLVGVGLDKLNGDSCEALASFFEESFS